MELVVWEVHNSQSLQGKEQKRATQRENFRDLERVPPQFLVESMRVKKLSVAMEKNLLKGSEETIQGAHIRLEIIHFLIDQSGKSS